MLTEAGRRLAYRGYDSAGCATVSTNGIDLRKDVGHVDEVAARLGFADMRGRRGIVQVRWATFGELARRNAQPHLDCDGDIVGAHNGNIINNVQMRELFAREGHTVRGENDGETCIHAVERHFDRGCDMVEAIRRAYADLEGDYAFVITHRDDDRLYAIKKGSGLVVGIGAGFTCCSSDLHSILPLTRRFLRVHDGEIVILGPHEIELRRVSDGALVERAPEVFEGEIPVADKGDFPHFILKEIHEQPHAVERLLRRLNEDTTTARFLAALRSAPALFLVGSGSSFHACLLGSYYFSRLAGKL
ncbi:MAG: glutamine--fructose-6-phosphate transaminase (isomerizing), partial [Anaerolineae bacterium]|nr:glutamine--fructose-6-phosphate transaminase (isomerizing) [Anaerolineae bacterium]